MATSFKKTSVVIPKILKEKITPDGVYWKNLETPITVKEYGAITDVDFCQVKPHNFAVSNSMRVQIYSSEYCQLNSTISRFKDVVYSGTYRADGKLLVAGTEDKYIKLFNPGTRSLLRTFMGHTGPVHVTKFLQDQFRVISGSDDKTVRVWDIPTEKEVHIYQEHQDYIRCGVASQSSQDLFLTGAYDHTVKLWDARTPSSVLTVSHGSPVESVLMFPNGGIFFSAGGNVVKVWDALAGGKLLATLSNHHKTVTSLCFCSNYERLMSASLDKHIKVYDVSTYQVVHTLSYSGPILSHAVSPDDQLLVVGMADKMLSIQKRKQEAEEKRKVSKPNKNLKLRGHAHHARTFVPSKTDLIVNVRKRELLAPYDRHLKSFNHSKALDSALEIRTRKNTPEVGVSVMQELIRRGHIRNALSGRDDKSLYSVLQFIRKNISNPQFMTTLLDVFNLILDIYGLSALMNSGPLVSLLVKIKEVVNTEVKLMTSVQEIMGSLDLLFTVAENHTLSIPSHSSADQNGETVDHMEVEDSFKTVSPAECSVLAAIGSLSNVSANCMVKT
ncbi:unnamed protein product [Lymnaea stagnalis]|uniref:U3 small nucleolar RNA-associated protein 15 homolog n=1 Tax=Lymnaea stagnalis TaxID=6523 RepID=A0AAV2I6Y6_LYMST